MPLRATLLSQEVSHASRDRALHQLDPPPQQRGPRLPRPVQHEQLDQFFAVITSARDRAMFLLMLRCGLRIAEVAGLRLNDLYVQEERPRLVARGKGGKERSVYLSP